jgi:hypothetical protein
MSYEFSRFDVPVDNARCRRSCKAPHGVYAVTYPDGSRLGTWELHTDHKPGEDQGYAFRRLHKHQSDGGMTCACAYPERF